MELNILRIHKEVKSARGPNVDPPDRPGSRMHCPAPDLTRPTVGDHRSVMLVKGR